MNKKRFRLFIALLTICTVMPLVLTACMKMNMSKEKISGRLKDNGYVLSYLSKTDWTADYSAHGVSITEILEANKDNSLKVYVYVCANSKSAKWVEDMCKDNTAKAEGAAKTYITYVYENNFTVMYGDYASVAIARNY